METKLTYSAPLVDKTRQALIHLSEDKWLYALTDFCLLYREIVALAKKKRDIGADDIIPLCSDIFAEIEELSWNHIIRLQALSETTRALAFRSMYCAVMVAPQSLLTAMIERFAKTNSRNPIELLDRLDNDPTCQEMRERAEKGLAIQQIDKNELKQIVARDVDEWIITPLGDKLDHNPILSQCQLDFGFEYITAEDAEYLRDRLTQYFPETSKNFKIINLLLSIFVAEKMVDKYISPDILAKKLASIFLENMTNYEKTNKHLRHRQRSYDFMKKIIPYVAAKNNIPFILSFLKVFLENLDERRSAGSRLVVVTEWKKMGKGNKFTRILLGSLQHVLGITSNYVALDKNPDKIYRSINIILSNIITKIKEIDPAFLSNERWRFDAIGKLLNYALIKEHEIKSHKEKIEEAYALIELLLKAKSPENIITLLSRIKDISLPLTRRQGKSEASRVFERCLVSVRDGVVGEVVIGKKFNFSKNELNTIFQQICNDVDVSRHAYALIMLIGDTSVMLQFVVSMLSLSQKINNQPVDINEFFYYQSFNFASLLTKFITEQKNVPMEIYIAAYVLNQRVQDYCAAKKLPIDAGQLVDDSLIDKECITANAALIEKYYYSPSSLRRDKASIHALIERSKKNTQPSQKIPLDSVLRKEL